MHSFIPNQYNSHDNPRKRHYSSGNTPNEFPQDNFTNGHYGPQPPHPVDSSKPYKKKKKKTYSSKNASVTQGNTPWYAVAPKAVLNTRFTKMKIPNGGPKYAICAPTPGVFECTIEHHLFGLVTCTASSKLEASRLCALEACRRLDEQGYFSYEEIAIVSQWNMHQAQQNVYKTEREPPPHPFAIPVPMRAADKKVSYFGDGRVTHISLSSSCEEHILRALGTSWGGYVDAQPEVHMLLPYEYMQLPTKLSPPRIISVSEMEKIQTGVEAGPRPIAPSIPILCPSEDLSYKHPFMPDFITAVRKQWAARQHINPSILAERSSLPVYQHKDQILHLLRTKPIVVLGSSTGSGKTTQIPQLLADGLLDELNDWFKIEPNAIMFQSLGGESIQGPLQIVVTQPRRVAATSMARRVAYEREENVGDGVGYQVRLDNIPAQARGVRITFCTTGVLLRRMIQDPYLKNVNTVIVDEVHERDVDSDLLITFLKKMWSEKDPAAHQSASGLLRRGHSVSPKLVLMSATFNMNSFLQYFSNAKASSETKQTHDGEKEKLVVDDDSENNVGVYELEGRLFPVQEMFLEDAILNAGIDLGPIKTKSVEKRVSSKLASMAESMRKRGVPDRLVQDLMRTCQLDEVLPNEIISQIILWLCRSAVVFKPPKDALDQASATNQSMPDETDGFLGSILVFLPGTKAITTLQGSLRTCLAGSSEIAPVEILPLHGNLSDAEQQRVFEPATAFKRKVILATNIAESSITISDVVYVIDSGKVKEHMYSFSTGTSSLTSMWCCRASCDQRKGRAGRVMPGYCIRLFTRERYNDEASIPLFPVPEIKRVSLEEVCLSVKALISGDNAISKDSTIESILAYSMDAPDPDAVTAAVNGLVQLGALVQTQGNNHELTPLGKQLTLLPVEPRFGKMMLLGQLFGCLDTMVTIVSILSCKDIFYRPMDAKEAANKSRRELSMIHAGGLTKFSAETAGKASISIQSDLLTMYRVFSLWMRCNSTTESRFLMTHYLSGANLRMVRGTKEQIYKTLANKLNYFSRDFPEQFANRHCDNLMLMKAVIYSCFPEQIAKVALTKPYSRTVSSNCGLCIHTKDSRKVHILTSSSIDPKLRNWESNHPPSFVLNSSGKEFETDFEYVPDVWIQFNYKSMSEHGHTGLNMITLLPPIILVLFGSEPTLYHFPYEAPRSIPFPPPNPPPEGLFPNYQTTAPSTPSSSSSSSGPVSTNFSTTSSTSVGDASSESPLTQSSDAMCGIVQNDWITHTSSESDAVKLRILNRTLKNMTDAYLRGDLCGQENMSQAASLVDTIADFLSANEPYLCRD